MMAARRDTRSSSRPHVGADRHIPCILMALFLSGLVPLLAAQEQAAREVAAPAKRLAVAVPWLEDRTADPDLAHWRYAASLLKGSLQHVKGVRILSKDAVDYAQRQVGLAAGTPIDPNTARRIGELIEAQRVVWGSYTRKDGRWQVEMRVLQVATGTVSPVLAATAHDWFDVRDALAEQVLHELEITPTDQEKAKMAKRWTRSPEALDGCLRTYLSQEQGQPVTAQERLSRQALGADPNCAHAHTILASTLANQGQFDVAEDIARKALQLDPETPSAHGLLGWIHLMQKQPTRAETEFRRACQLDPDDADDLMWLAAAYRESGRPEEAIGLLEIAVSLERTNALVHAHLAQAYAARKRPEEALRELEEARRYLPEGISAGNALMMIGDAYRSLGRGPEALESYERVLVQAQGRGLNPNVIRQIAQRIQGVKSFLTPTLIEAATPRRYTPEALDALRRELLSEAEQQLARNPFSCTDAMTAWARELTQGATTDIEKAKAIFEGLAARPKGAGPLKSRTARQVFEAWNQAEVRLVCMDHAVLFVALARAVDVQAFFTNVTRLPDGKVINHACAAVFLGERAVLTDSSLRWFGAPHQQYEVLDDVQTTAFLCFNNWESDPRELAACRAGLKLWPQSVHGQLALAGTLLGARQWEEARRVLRDIGAPPAKEYETATYWSLHGLAALQEQNWQEGERLLLQATAVDPGNKTALFNLGQLYYEQRRPAEARTAFRAYLRNEPSVLTAAVARHRLAQINEEIGFDAPPDTPVLEPKPQ